MTNAEIQVGEYVRTNNARGIKKVARINEAATVNRYLFIDGYDHSDTIYGIIRADQITKHSFNLIDLIEVGDYIKIGIILGDRKYIDNACSYVSYVGTSNGKRFIEIDCGQDGTAIFTDSKQIETIVTHEQFKAMEYKVGVEDD